MPIVLISINVVWAVILIYFLYKWFVTWYPKAAEYGYRAKQILMIQIVLLLFDLLYWLWR